MAWSATKFEESMPNTHTQTNMHLSLTSRNLLAWTYIRTLYAQPLAKVRSDLGCWSGCEFEYINLVTYTELIVARVRSRTLTKLTVITKDCPDGFLHTEVQLYNFRAILLPETYTEGTELSSILPTANCTAIRETCE